MVCPACTSSETQRLRNFIHGDTVPPNRLSVYMILNALKGVTYHADEKSSFTPTAENHFCAAFNSKAARGSLSVTGLTGSKLRKTSLTPC
ncbi:hypothetical protein DPMN_066086 [Dreissena polymorpha]|uniref:Uncharacterized protein n=1 Tax=Dreissena polymorpha TaxID=45954 RepID=A0A9D4BUQ5_DREPO|nr:hypothetical protein DPMN_066086 [Dreissena polymorpha]